MAKMNWNCKLLFLFASLAIFSDCYSVRSQVVEDDSLSTEVNTENNIDFQVDGGENRGGNLFHSFSELSVPNDGSVFFNNETTIQNIISRVTGNSISQIDGLIRSNGTANLFLLNSNGIIFGENASLDIGGSFVGTTAESLLFEEGQFGSSPDNASSLLTVNVPLGLQFGSNPGVIVNQANNQISNSLDASPEIESGLAIAPGKTLALLGNGIIFNGGAATSPGGNLELGSVAENSFVALESIAEGWKANYDAARFEDIRLDNSASVDASGTGGGRINVTGKNIQILNGSSITSNTIGNFDGRDIGIKASEQVTIKGSDRTGTEIDPLLARLEIFLPAASRISSSTRGSGNGGDVNIMAQSLQLIDGGAIELQTFPNSTTGSGGDLSVTVNDSVLLSGFRPLLGVGENAASIVSPEIGLEAAVDLNQSSEISTASISSGNAGNIKLTGRNLTLEDGGVIGATPFDKGDAGDIDLNFRDFIEIRGASPRTQSFGSSIAANTFADGNAGDLAIDTGRLTIKDGGVIVSSTVSSTDSSGDAGNIEINAASIEISGFPNPERLPSSISTRTVNSGNGGNVVLDTGSLTVSDRARINVRSEGLGIPGNLAIEADSIELDNFASITAATEFGEGGNIELDLEDNLILRNNSTISARAFNNANGGNLKIAAGFIVAFPQENNDILANALFGSGGNVSIDAEGVFGIEERNSLPQNFTNDIDASSEFGLAGEVAISFPNISSFEVLDALPETLDAEALFKNTFCKIRSNSKFVTTGRNGIPFLPDRDIQSTQTWSDWRIVQGESAVNTEKPSEVREATTPKKIVMIQGWVTNAEGDVILTDKPLVATSRQPVLKTPDCNRVRNNGQVEGRSSQVTDQK